MRPVADSTCDKCDDQKGRSRRERHEFPIDRGRRWPFHAESPERLAKTRFTVTTPMIVIRW